MEGHILGAKNFFFFFRCLTLMNHECESDFEKSESVKVHDP